MASTCYELIASIACLFPFLKFWEDNKTSHFILLAIKPIGLSYENIQVAY